jgi:carbonic anhydrase
MDLPARFLLENLAWADEVERREPAFFDALSSGQQPGVFWIGCADSRVPAERITNAAPGELFVHRSVANLALPTDNSLMSALQYAVDELKVRHVIVCGHDACGGVRAALMAARAPVVEPIRAHMEPDYLGERIRPLRELYGRHRVEVDSADSGHPANDATRLAEQVDRLVALNVRAQVDHLAATGVVRRAWQRGQPLALHGWVYGLRDGRLRELSTLDEDRLDEAQAA